MPETNLTRQITKAQEIDFSNQFGNNIKRLLELLSVQRRIPVGSGTTLRTYKSAKVTLDGTKVEPGAVIPLSKVEMVEADKIEIEWDKKRKAVPAEDIQKYGFDRAVEMTDKALIRELQKGLRQSFITQLEKGTGEATGIGLQQALAQGWGKVQVAFEDDAVRTIAFVNPLDVAAYNGNAQITIQSAFGLNYVENFLGVDVAIITSLVEEKKAYVTAADNLVFAYVDVRGELSNAFDLTTEETGIIGVTKDVNKQRLTSETVTIYGSALFAERLDGVVKVTIDETPAA